MAAEVTLFQHQSVTSAYQDQFSKVGRSTAWSRLCLRRLQYFPRSYVYKSRWTMR